MNSTDPQASKSDGSSPVEGEYLAPDRSNRASLGASPQGQAGRNWRAGGGAAVGLALLAAKFKALLFALLNLKWLLFAGKFALTGFSFLASIWFYALYFGWKFAVVFVLLIAVHELGHAIFVRGYGLALPGIYFVPGLGAFTAWRGNTSAYQESVIAFGGPLLGTLGGIACLGYGIVTSEPFWIACAYTAFFLNLFNMIPLGFFDGGRITASLSRNFWIGGFVLVVVLAIAFHWWSPILLIVIVLSLPRMIAAWRGDLEERYAAVTAGEKLAIGTAYFALLGLLLACLVISRTAVPGSIFPYR